MNNIFAEQDLSLIDENKTEIDYNAGDIVLKQGSYVSQVLYLKKGAVKVVLEGKNDRNTILKVTHKNSFIALPVLGNPDIYPFSVVALTHCEICHIRKDTILGLSNRNIDFYKFLLHWYYQDYLMLYQRISVLSTRNNHGKLASAIMYILQENSSNLFIDHLNRKELAELASISVESTNKILQELNHDGIIDIKKGVIEIKRPDLMEKLSSVG